MASLLQVPLHMMHFGLIQTIAGDPEHAYHAAMSTGGTLWFENLLIPDPYGALPCISAFLQIINMRLMAKRRPTTGPMAGQLESMSKFMMVMPIMFLPVQMSFPVALNLYFGILAAGQLATMGISDLTVVKRAFRV